MSEIRYEASITAARCIAGLVPFPDDPTEDQIRGIAFFVLEAIHECESRFAALPVLVVCTGCFQPLYRSPERTGGDARCPACGLAPHPVGGN